MAYKINGTTVVDNSRNVCACCVTSCCITASTKLDAPSGNTASRPSSPATGSLYFDTDEGSLLSYDGSDWAAVGGSGVVPDCVGLYHQGFFSPCFFGQRSSCYLRLFGQQAANLSPNGTTFNVLFTCCTTDKVPAGCPSCVRTTEILFHYDNPLCSSSHTSGGLSEPQSTVRNMGMNFASYAGFDDQDPRATPMFTADGPEANNACGIFFFAQSADAFCGRKTCPCFCTNCFNCGNTYPRGSLFRPSGWHNSNTCCWGKYVAADSCCGVWVGFVASNCSNCCNNSGRVFAAFGFKPCLFYSTSCCADPTTTPVKYSSHCPFWNTATKVITAIDWPTKQVVLVYDWSCCAVVQRHCLCDKGFPNCQSCWCLTCSPICASRIAGSNLTYTGSAMFCHRNYSDLPAKVWGDYLFTFGCDNKFIQGFHICGSDTFTMRFSTPSSSNCFFCMCFYNIIVDKDCNLRLYGRMPCLVNTPNCGFSFCDTHQSFYEFLYTPGTNLKTGTPCQINIYRPAANCCAGITWPGASNVQGDCGAPSHHVTYEPISNRLSIPFMWCNLYPGCAGGSEGSILITNLYPASCTGTKYLTPSSGCGIIPIYKQAISTGCYRLNVCVGNSCCQNSILVCTCVGGGGSNWTSCYFNCLNFQFCCGVALCAGCCIMKRCDLWFYTHCYQYWPYRDFLGGPIQKYKATQCTD